MAKRKTKTNIQDLDIDLERDERINTRFMMLISASAFTDLGIDVFYDQHTESIEVDFTPEQRRKAETLLKATIGEIPDPIFWSGQRHGTAWRDIANSEFQLNVPDSTPVDESLAERIGVAIKRRIEKSKNVTAQRADTPTQAEIEAAQPFILANPMITRDALATRMGIGHDKITPILDHYRTSGLYKRKKRNRN